MTSDRHILHVDMDAFFAAVEQLDRPELRGRPVLVGGRPDQRGVVSTASYEARPFGCHSAMPMARAVRLCPEAVVVAPRFERYVEVSRQIFAVFGAFTPLIEPLSIDEAFLDVTGSTRLLGPPEAMARRLKQQLQAETRLTASVGVAPNKFLAKLASDLEKPDGLVVVDGDRVEAFLDPLPISRLWGVGKSTLARMASLKIHTFGDLRRFDEADLVYRFGEPGAKFYRLIRGLDDRPVVPDHQAKSISHETTFPVDVADHDYLRSVLLGQTDHVARRLRRQRLFARTVTLKIRSADFSTITRSATLEAATDETDQLWQTAGQLFETWRAQRPPPVRLLGMGVSQLRDDAPRQLQLFEPDGGAQHRKIDRAVDAIRERFGDDAVARGGTMKHTVGDKPSRAARKAEP